MRPSQPSRRLILASSSQYRRELLARLNVAFDIVVPDIDEEPLPEEAPDKTALRLAMCKAEAVAVRHPDAAVIGSDQVATLDGLQIGKPGTHGRAMEQLKKMQGRSVVFYTALAFVDSDAADGVKNKVTNVQTDVTFRSLPDRELEAYLRIERPYDCAGSAKNESLGIALIERINSPDPTALTGLPLIALTTFLRQSGFELFR